MSVQSKKTKQKQFRRGRAHRRIRGKVVGVGERPRLSVYKSRKYVYAQIIDDRNGQTLAAASSIEPTLKGALDGTGNKAAARKVGETLAERAKAKGIERVVFDRGGYIYHGKVKEVAEGARDKGLEF
jgi:large subunit ribosomal protein L18